MGENSGIQWTTHTFNPWVGCQRVSPGCEHCYAESYDKRVGGGVDPKDGVKKLRWGPKAPRVRTSVSNWNKPLKWNDAAKAAGERHRVFCSSLADVFEDRPELTAWRADLFTLIAKTPHLDWLLLTKRPQNIMRLLRIAAGVHETRLNENSPAQSPEAFALINDWLAGKPPKNVWLGTTVEDQQRANERIPELLKVPAVVRFLSCEPLLELVDLSRWLGDLWECPTCGFDWQEAGARLASPKIRYCGMCAGDNGRDVEIRRLGRGISWVIIGGESGGGARPFNVAWARSLVAQARGVDGCAPFVKQLGAHVLDNATIAFGHGPRGPLRVKLDDSAGGDMAEWPEDLRVREFPR